MYWEVAVLKVRCWLRALLRTKHIWGIVTVDFIVHNTEYFLLYNHTPMATCHIQVTADHSIDYLIRWNDMLVCSCLVIYYLYRTHFTWINVEKRITISQEYILGIKSWYIQWYIMSIVYCKINGSYFQQKVFDVTSCTCWELMWNTYSWSTK